MNRPTEFEKAFAELNAKYRDVGHSNIVCVSPNIDVIVDKNKTKEYTDLFFQVRKPKSFISLMLSGDCTRKNNGEHTAQEWQR